MTTRILLTLAAVCGGAQLELATDYTRERTLEIEAETAWTLALVDLEMSRGGEPFEPPRDRDDRERPDVTEARRIASRDTVLAHVDGAPTRVRREFGSVGAKLELDPAPGPAGGLDVESPLGDVTLELSVAGDGIEVEVVDGERPERALLEGHRLELALDGLLPADVVPGVVSGKTEVGTEWELEDEAILRALGLDLDALFPMPERERSGEREDEGGRRGRLTGLRESIGRVLARADWEGTATLADDADELDGVPCLRVELHIEASGESEDEIEAPGGRGSAERSVRVDVELEGDLFFSVEERRPMLLRLEGDLSVERHVARDGGGRGFELRITQEGELSHTTYVRVD